MKKKLPLFLILFLISLKTFSQYTLKSDHIKNPDLNIDYVVNCANFWKTHGPDPVGGGFFSFLSRNGTVTNQYSKSLISHTRLAYGFTRAFMLTGDETYLALADTALDFLFKHGWDHQNDGWFCGTNRYGVLSGFGGWNPNSYKWSFQQHYALVGIIPNYEATLNPNVKKWMDKGVKSIYTHMWDSRPGYEGYYEEANSDWSNPRKKGFTPTVDGITTNAEMSYLVYKDPVHKKRLWQLGDNIVDHLVGQMDEAYTTVGFPEEFDTDWNPNLGSKNLSVGHFIKTSWCLGRVYLTDTSNLKYKKAA